MQSDVIKILLIEDNLIDQEIFEHFVIKEKLNYQYTIATTLKNAIAQLETRPFDLILADINLADGSAFDLYSHIPTFIPVIFITEIDCKQTILEALKLGVGDYIFKKAEGEHLNVLPECIDRLLNKQKTLFQHIKSQIELHKDSIQSSLKVPSIVLESLVFKTHIGVVITDANAVILRINKGFSDITGYSSPEVIGKNMNILNSGKQDKFFYEHFWKQLVEKGTFQGALWNRGKDHTLYRQWATITAVADDKTGETKYIAILSNITEQYRLEQEMHQLAFYDALTSLANRRLLLNRIRQELAMTKRRETYGSIIYLDIDKFKLLNDSYGHHAGDQLLIQVSQRLKAILREEDTASRLGGDEFVILIHATKSNIDNVVKDALFVSNKIKDRLNKPFQLDGVEISITPSIGYTVFPDNDSIAEELLQRADKAMYCSKNKGGNSVSMFLAENECQENELVFHVMLIEDKTANTLLTIETLKTFCVDCGLTLDIKTFSDGQIGLDYLDTHDSKIYLPDLIFLDLNLPGMDGYDVLKQIKSKCNTKKIPVVVFAVETEYTIIDKCLELQASDVVQKPLTADNFKQVIRNCGMGSLLMNKGL